MEGERRAFHFAFNGISYYETFKNFYISWKTSFRLNVLILRLLVVNFLSVVFLYIEISVKINWIHTYMLFLLWNEQLTMI